MNPLADAEGAMSVTDIVRATELYRYTNEELVTYLLHQVRSEDRRFVDVPVWLIDEIVERLKEGE